MYPPAAAAIVVMRPIVGPKAWRAIVRSSVPVRMTRAPSTLAAGDSVATDFDADEVAVVYPWGVVALNCCSLSCLAAPEVPLDTGGSAGSPTRPAAPPPLIFSGAVGVNAR